VLAHINTNWDHAVQGAQRHRGHPEQIHHGRPAARQSPNASVPAGRSYRCGILSVGHAEPLRAELQAFASAIRSGQAAAVTGEEGVAGL